MCNLQRGKRRREASVNKKFFLKLLFFFYFQAGLMDNQGVNVDEKRENRRERPLRRLRRHLSQRERQGLAHSFPIA